MPPLSLVLKLLLARREQPWRGFFLVVTLPVALLALGAIEYGGAWFYALLTVVCLLQAIYPTLLGWASVAAMYCAGALGWLIDLVQGVARSSVDSDSGFEIFLLVGATAIAVALFLHRPRPLKE
jgi:hypothetical protein